MNIAVSIDSSSKKAHMKCDYYFKEIIEIDSQMIHYLEDANLKHLYHQRNKSRDNCFDFYKKLFNKLDEIFAFIKDDSD